MDRHILTIVLDRIAPALSTKDLIQVLACFCFGKTEVYAYDDQVCLIHPYDGHEDFVPNIRGAVRGRLLLDFLHASRSKTVEVEGTAGSGSMTVKCGRAKLDVPVLPESDFLFEPPPMKKAKEITLSETFLGDLRTAAASMGHDPSNPWRLGVTLIYNDAGYAMYSTDNKTITRVTSGSEVDPDQDLVTLLPPRFVELLLDLSKKDVASTLQFTKDWVQIQFAGGMRLFSKSISGASPKEYVRMVGGVEGRADKPSELPKGIDRCFERALTVTPFAKEPFTQLSVKGDRLRFKTISPAGEVADSLPLTGAKEISIRVPPEIARKGLGRAKSLTLFEDCIRLGGKGYLHLIATIQSAEETGGNESAQ